jgi:hypothetical protein
LEKEKEEMSQNEAIEDYIFATGKTAPNNAFHIDLGLKEPPLRYVSTNSAENTDDIYEEIIDDYWSKNYDRPNAPSNNKYDYLDFAHYKGTANKKEQIKSSFFNNKKKLIILSSILFVVAIVAIIAVIMIVLATYSKRI